VWEEGLLGRGIRETMAEKGGCFFGFMIPICFTLACVD
jgi:hypothetical protein